MVTPWQRPCSLRSLVWTTSVGPGYSVRKKKKYTNIFDLTHLVCALCQEFLFLFSHSFWCLRVSRNIDVLVCTWHICPYGHMHFFLFNHFYWWTISYHIKKRKTYSFFHFRQRYHSFSYLNEMCFIWRLNSRKSIVSKHSSEHDDVFFLGSNVVFHLFYKQKSIN